MLPSSPKELAHRVALWIILALICSLSIKIMLLFDFNKRAYNHAPGPCKLLDGMEYGAPGMELLKENGEVFITTGQHKTAKGGILLYKLGVEHTLPYATKLTIQGKDFDERNFHPTGISSYTSKGRTTLYVINEKCIEVFIYNKEKTLLIHRKSICDPSFYSLTDIVVVGADKFFVAKESFFEEGWLQSLELVLLNSLGSLYYFNGHTATIALSGLTSPSALALDSQRHLLYVASTMGENIKMYTLEQDLSLTHRTDISLLSSPSGLHIDEASGDIWTSLHPVLHQYWMNSKFAEYFNKGVKKISPSQVLRIRLQSDQLSWVITEPYSNDGATLPASSSVVFYGEQMLIGGYNNKLLFCDVINPQIT